ncbi:hypothetical protein IH992_31265 [Candidatus Poribacteria bacterium]|nr:hypothetical protein [Candidatus Poribacteria bacterium]
MKRVTLHQVLEQVKMLTPDEQRELREILDFVLASHDNEVTEELFERMMVEKGIMTVPPPNSPVRSENWKPVEVKGKPVSEILIEERR